MERISLPTILFIVSASSILVAVSLAGGSVAKSVKWNFYNSHTNFGGKYWFKLYAYQNLWTSYDKSQHTKNPEYVQAYRILKNDSWRELPRMLVLGSVGSGLLSALVLGTFSLIPVLKKTGFKNGDILLNVARIVSSVFSIASGVLLAYALQYYKHKHPSLLAPAFFDKKSKYPDEDNVSTGFYMASIACALFVISAIINIVNVVIYIKRSKTAGAVKPTNQVAGAPTEDKS